MFEFFLYLFRIRENRYDAENKPRFSHREVGFCCFDEAPYSPAGRDFRFTPTICRVLRPRRIKKYCKVAVI
jgi:hypothetical protein